jgi:DNA replication protein DnaC
MLDNTTIDQLHTLKLDALAKALVEQRAQPDIHSMSFEERLALLVQRELDTRAERRQTRLLQLAGLKYPRAAIEDLESTPGRGIDRKTLMSLALGPWIERGDTVLLGGCAGVGKTWIACALGQYACRRGHSARYLRVPRLPEELRLLHGSGQFGKWLIALAKLDVLILDDWGLATLDAQTRADLLEMIDDRAARKATVITTQLPVEHWHAWIGDATIADAICDRLLERAHRFTLSGESRRIPSTQTKKGTPKAKAEAEH